MIYSDGISEIQSILNITNKEIYDYGIKYGTKKLLDKSYKIGSEDNLCALLININK